MNEEELYYGSLLKFYDNSGRLYYGLPNTPYTGLTDISGLFIDSETKWVVYRDNMSIELFNKIKEQGNNMNKKEVNQRIHNLEEELAELKSLLEQPEGRWRAEKEGSYCFVGSCGSIRYWMEGSLGIDVDNDRYEIGNYFQTEEQAMRSNIYKILNSEYEYYFAGVSDNFEDLPKDYSAELFCCDSESWVTSSDVYDVYLRSCNYRWKRK